MNIRPVDPERLSEFGLRPTRARVMILDLLNKVENHLSPDQIIAALARKGSAISPATLYQNLNKMSSRGVLRCFQGVDGKMHFDSNIHHHHHLLCTNCGTINDIDPVVPISQSFRISLPKAGQSLEKWDFSREISEIKGVCPFCKAAKG